MASHNFPALKIVQPSTILPEMVLQQSQRSGWKNLFGGGIQSRIKEGDKVVYMRGLTMTNNGVVATQGSTMQLPSVTFTPRLAQARVLLLQSGANYDHHDLAGASNHGFALPAALDLAHEQGMAHQKRNMDLFGLRSDEGLLNQVTHISVAADQTTGATTWSAYNAGELAVDVLAGTINDLAIATYTLGVPNKAVILAPQRIISLLMSRKVVQLFSFQMVGGGTATSGEMAQKLCANVNLEVEMYPDETLKNAGSGSKDVVIVSIPELTPYQQVEPDALDTNSFGELQPNTKSNNLSLVDRAKPTRIVSPLPRGATDVLYELGATCGWAIRPETTVALEMIY